MGRTEPKRKTKGKGSIASSIGSFLFGTRRVYIGVSEEELEHIKVALEHWVESYPTIANEADDEEVGQLFKDFVEMGELWQRLMKY